MNDDQFGDPISGDWPTPAPYTGSPKPTWWERFVLWLKGWNTDEA